MSSRRCLPTLLAACVLSALGTVVHHSAQAQVNTQCTVNYPGYVASDDINDVCIYGSGSSLVAIVYQSQFQALFTFFSPPPPPVSTVDYQRRRSAAAQSRGRRLQQSAAAAGRR
jgi:hypothetical protein